MSRAPGSVPAPLTAEPPASARRRVDLPAWPLLTVLGGMPLWWVLGLTPFLPVAYLLVVGGMIATARHPGALRLPAGAGPLLGFVAWALPCAVMLDSGLRLVGFAVRWTSLAAAAVVVAHVANSRGLTTRRVLLALAGLWALVLVGGYLGVLWPDGGFRTPMAAVMPAPILSNELVHDLLVPHFAEVQTPWGAAAPFNRPSAPFAYTNGWGWAVAFLTPLMLALRTRLRSRWARTAILLGIAASLVPAAATRNRGMLIMTGVWVVVALIGLAVRGRVAAAAFVTGGVLAVGVLFVRLDVLGLIAERAQASDSTAGRAEVYLATLRATLESPLLGYGAPRGSEEIGVALGTQGAIWMYLFSYGFIGAALFLTFLVGVALRGARLGDQRGGGGDTALLWVHAAVCAAVVGIAFYGLDSIQLFALAAACALVLRAGDPRTTSDAAPR